MYDYLIVGTGLYGAVYAKELSDTGKRILVIDKCSHIAGNIYTENIEGFNVHKYDEHIFHTIIELYGTMLSVLQPFFASQIHQ